MKKHAIFLIAAVLAAVLVYAFAVDSDGGFDPFTFGICTEYNATNATFWDWCTGGFQGGLLKEYQVVNDQCHMSYVNCANYNHVENGSNASYTYFCRFGKCVEQISLKV